VSLALCATDPDINAFKPHPKGFLHACRHWGVPPEEVLYIGDRPEVDAVGAATASMPCAILTVKTRTGTYAPVTYDTFSSFIRLHYALTRNS
jgi:FMN phosphatase YigB (HAD superfamily)